VTYRLCVLNVLVACEESQRVAIAFRELGHNAFSCDIQEPSGVHPEWHIKGDVLAFLNPVEVLCCGQKRKAIAFDTMDGKPHIIPEKWDLIIAHPPCTYLSNAGARHLYKGHQLNMDRYQKGLQGKELFMQIYNANCDKICIENPIPSKVYELPQYTQIIQPYEYGHPYTKRTCLWLKNLPKLKPTNIVEPIGTFCPSGSYSGKHNEKHKGIFTKDRAKNRSKTFEGVAEAMAKQWSAAVLAGYTDKKQPSLFEEG
jgi:hypothetical protein